MAPAAGASGRFPGTSGGWPSGSRPSSSRRLSRRGTTTRRAPAGQRPAPSTARRRPSPALREADPELPVAARERHRAHVDLLDLGERRPAPQVPHELVDRFQVALRSDLDAPVREIHGVSGETPLAGAPLSKIAVADPLDAPSDQHFDGAQPSPGTAATRTAVRLIHLRRGFSTVIRR